MPDCPTNEQLSQFLVGNLSTTQIDALAEHLENCLRCQEIVETLDDVPDTIVSQVRAEAAIDVPALSLDCERMLEQAAVLLDIPIATEDASALGRVRDYRLLAKLGEGGMGTVYKALHVNLKRIVALKVLPADRMRNQQAVSRFYREMEAVGKLHHPNIVHATDAGQDRGTHYLVMEYIDGIVLSELVHRAGPLPIADACELVRQAATGLQHACEHGLVHRDIKPSNLILAGSVQETSTSHPANQSRSAPILKILDLGLARLAESPEEMVTSTGQVMGTLDYMAPEQADDSHEVDIRADIYSLGATLYKLLCGRAPFGDKKYDTPVKKLNALTTASIPAIRERRTDLPDALVALLDRMLSRSPTDRPATPGEVAAALVELTTGSDLAALAERAARGKASGALDAGSTTSTFRHLSSAMTGTHDGDLAVSVSESTDLTAQDEASRQAFKALEFAPDRNFVKTNPAARWWIGIGLASLIAIGIAAGVLFKVKTPGGTIVLEGDPAALEGAEVFVDDQHTLTIRLAGDDKPITVSADRQRGKLRVEKAGFKAFVESFEFTIGKREHSIAVRFEPQVKDSQPASASSSKPAVAWLTGPEEGIMPGIVQRPATLPGMKRWQAVLSDARYFNGTVAWSHDSRFVAAGTLDGHLRIYELTDGWLQLVQIVPGIRSKKDLHACDVNAVAWQPGKHILAFSSDFDVFIYDVASRRVLRTISHSVYQLPKSISWSPDGTLFATTTDVLSVWNAQSGELELELKEHIESVAWHPTDDVIASGGFDKIVRVWDLKNPDNTIVLKGHTSNIGSVAWSPDGKRLASRGDTTLRIWDWRSGLPEQVIDVATTLRKNDAISWSPDGTLITCDGRDALQIWSTKTGNARRYSVGADVWTTAWSRNGEWIASYDGSAQRLRLWNVSGNKRGPDVLASPNPIHAVGWSPDGQSFVIGSADGVARVFSASSGEIMSRFEGHLKTSSDSHSRAIRCAAFSGDGQWVATGAHDQTVQIWNPSNGRLHAVFHAHTGEVFSVGWSPDSRRIASAGNDGTIRICDLETTEPILTLKGHERRVASVSWHPTDDYIVSTGDTTIRVWRPSTGATVSVTNIRREQGEPLIGHVLCWSPSGKQLAFGGPPSIRLWNFSNGQLEPTTALEGENPNSITWHPNSQQIAYAGSYNHVMVYDTATSRRVFSFHAHPRSVFALAWSPQGDTLLSGGEMGMVRRWDERTGAPLSSTMLLSKGNAVTFNAAGQITAGDPQAIEAEVLYVAENDDGTLDLLKPSEFAARIGQSLRSTTPSTVALSADNSNRHAASPARRLAESVLSLGGRLRIDVRDGATDRPMEITASSQLPSGEFKVAEVDLREKSLTDERLAELARLFPEACSHNPYLYLDLTAITDAGLAHLRGQRIALLALGRTAVTDRGLALLHEIDGLHQLTLDSAKLNDAALQEVSRIKNLGYFNLYNNSEISDDGWQHLADLKELVGIGFTGTKISLRAWERFVADHPKLDSIQMMGTSLGDEGLRVLPVLKQLRFLEADSVTDTGLVHMKKLPSLRTLRIHSSEITDVGFATLSELSGVEQLDLNHVRPKLTELGIAHLTRLKKLSLLELAGSGLTDEGLAQLKPLSELESFNISDTAITDAGVEHLMEFKKLRTLIIRNTKITAAGAERLQQALPQCKIEF